MKNNRFIAWDIRNSKIVLDALQTSGTQQLVTVNGNYFNSPFSFFDGCVWLQSTGLFDKNKKEIFEGASDGKRYVTYIESSGGYCFMRISNGDSQLRLMDETAKLFEVKGYFIKGAYIENPEETT